MNQSMGIIMDLMDHNSWTTLLAAENSLYIIWSHNMGVVRRQTESNQPCARPHKLSKPSDCKLVRSRVSCN